LNYINGKTDQLENIFAQLNIDDNEEKLSTHCTSVREKELFFFSYFQILVTEKYT